MNCILLVLAGLAALAHSATVPPDPMMTTEVAMAAANTTEEDCDDDAATDCWSRPDIDCFGIYEAWSNVHCPLRCGFCKTKVPPCVDKLSYCSQFDDNTCTDENYRIWARTNCRKHCNLCQVPTRPPNMSVEPTPSGGTTAGGASISEQSTPTPIAFTTATNPPAPTTPMPSSASGIPGTVAKGVQSTVVVQGAPGATPGMCFYKNTDYKEGARWKDGCAYECTCMNAAANRVICTERCTHWQIMGQLSGCKVERDDSECCPRLICSP